MVLFKHHDGALEHGDEMGDHDDGVMENCGWIVVHWDGKVVTVIQDKGPM